MAQAYEGVRDEMSEAARNHRKIASNIRELVVSPFARWCDQHAARVQNSQDDLQGRIRAHDRQAETIRQYRSAYFNKCRRMEDLDEEEKLAFQDPNSTAAAGTAPPAAPPSVLSVPSIKVEEDDDEEPEPIDIGDSTYQPEQVKRLLTHALENVRLGETKVPILGTYQNVSTGSDITEYIQKNMGNVSIAYAERIGQDLIHNGFLRLVGNVGNTFANSSRMNYQWRTKVFQITGIPEKRPKLAGRTTTLSSVDNTGSAPHSPVIGDRVTDLWNGGWNPLNNPNETPSEKLKREAKDADERYKVAVKRLDSMRCTLEEAMIDHFKFMERCELDRLKAIKSVVLDFSGSISNVIPSLQSTVDNMMLFQETVQPLSDLRYLLENYRTGNYIPKVLTYENYYNSVDEQTFGVDIEARARADKKRVPLIVTTILTFLDSHYPDLEGDATRREIWVVDVPLAATHRLRSEINNGKPPPMDLLERYEIPIVAAVLKLYLLELPDSLVSSHLYEIVKTIYTTTSHTSSEQARVQVIQSTLGQLRLANIATLDALVTHFTRLIELTSADEAYVANLASILAPCILRPKQESGLSMAEKYHVRLVRDLFAHKDAIFGELKRQSSLTHTASGATRPTRAISMDESRRKEAMEERHRAIAAAQHAQGGPGSSRSRQPSPSSTNRVPAPEERISHRRDRSRGPETRFPIATATAVMQQRSPPSPSSSNRNGPHRDSLSVPQTPPPASSRQTALPAAPSPPKPAEPARVNGSLHRPPPADPEHNAEPTEIRTSNDLPSNRTSLPPNMSATAGPGDFSGHYYHQAPESPSQARTSAGSDSAKEHQSPIEVIKRDSQNRNARIARKPADSGSSLQRQSLTQMAGANEAAGHDSAGVQLEDRPVDFD